MGRCAGASAANISGRSAGHLDVDEHQVGPERQDPSYALSPSPNSATSSKPSRRARRTLTASLASGSSSTITTRMASCCRLISAQGMEHAHVEAAVRYASSRPPLIIAVQVAQTFPDIGQADAATRLRRPLAVVLHGHEQARA